MVRPTCALLIALFCLHTGASAEDPPEAVKVGLKKGIDAVNSGHVAEGIAHLERVVKAAPRVGHYRYLLAAAYSQARRADDAWKQLRLAVRLDPTHRQAVQAFDGMWRRLDSKGAFNAGAGTAAVQDAVGRPDDKTGRGGDEKWAYGYMAVEFRRGRLYQVVDTRGLRRLPDAAASWHLPLDLRQWSVGHRMANQRGAVAEWVRNSESVQDWTRLFTVQRMFRRGGATRAHDLLKKIEADLKRVCPNAEVKIVRDGAKDLVYEWSIPEGERLAAQHELARIVIGKTDAHRIAYTGRGAQMPSDERARWLKELGEARLVPRR